MKKLILALFIVSISLVSHAQVSWDIRAGANVSGVTNTDTQMKLGAKAGIGMEYALTDMFALRPSLFFTMKGYSISKNNMGFNPKETLKLNYLEMPVLASFRFKTTDNLTIAFNAGPYVAYRLSKNTDGDLPKYRDMDWGAMAGIDFVIKKFVIGVDGAYGASTLFKESGSKQHNVNYSLTLGYKF